MYYVVWMTLDVSTASRWLDHNPVGYFSENQGLSPGCPLCLLLVLHGSFFPELFRLPVQKKSTELLPFKILVSPPSHNQTTVMLSVLVFPWLHIMQVLPHLRCDRLPQDPPHGEGRAQVPLGGLKSAIFFGQT